MSDTYYKDYIRFMGIVNYGRPAGEYFPKLTLLETMGVIVNESRQYDFLQRVLPHYERTLPADYRVEISMSESRLKVLRPGKKEFDEPGRPPVLRAFSRLSSRAL